jgi:glycosyltransferase involved in cell wall biosynthesis
VPELVVLVEQLLAPVPGGTGRYTRELTAALAKTAPAGWVVSSAVARRTDPSAAVIPGVEGPKMLPLTPRALTYAWEHRWPLWPGGDSVHATTPLAPAAARRSRSLVVTVHDTVPWTYPETLTHRGANWHRKVVSRATYAAGAIVVPSSAVAAELTMHAPGTARVHVVPPGVPAVLSAPPDQDTSFRVRSKLSLPEQYLLAVGTVEPRKGLDVLIDALTRPKAPDLPLVVAGQPGWGGINLADIAMRKGLPVERLTVLGKVSDEELSVVLHGASAFVMPSLAEGFGLPLLEAMAAGVPVVHTDVPALVEVAGGTGVLARRQDPLALAKALHNVFDDTARTEARVARARLRAATYTWERAAHAVWNIHLDLYQNRLIGLT